MSFGPVPALPDLHDAGLVGLEVEWASGSAIVSFENARRAGAESFAETEFVDVALVLHGVVELRVERREPWGPSEWALEARCVGRPEGGIRLSIDMQSGDPIEILAASCEVQATTAANPPRAETRLRLRTESDDDAG
jgi:hypothetical protein